MHYICGQTVAQTERGGYIVFDSDLLPAGHQDDCRVVIQPKPTYNQGTAGSFVLFYFSGFQVGNNCHDTNLTIHDGNGVNMQPIKGTVNPLYTETRCNDKFRYTDNLNGTKPYLES